MDSFFTHNVFLNAPYFTKIFKYNSNFLTGLFLNNMNFTQICKFYSKFITGFFKKNVIFFVHKNTFIVKLKPYAPVFEEMTFFPL